MIEFACRCGKRFSVLDSFAGRKARCKGCGVEITVPQRGGAAVANVAAKPAAPVAPKIPMRTRRLLADHEQMQRVFKSFPLIRVQSVTGDPPELYKIEYRVKGLDAGKNGTPITREHHLVEIHLTSDYPRLSPMCKMLTPTFHPNIDTSTICVGDHWTAGERLADLVVRIGEMLSYQAYNIRSPLDGEAAMWADLNGPKLPIDTRNLRPPEMDQ
jgi:ubiquitin-protein ligase